MINKGLKDISSTVFRHFFAIIGLYFCYYFVLRLYFLNKTNNQFFSLSFSLRYSEYNWHDGCRDLITRIYTYFCIEKKTSILQCPNLPILGILHEINYKKISNVENCTKNFAVFVIFKINIIKYFQFSTLFCWLTFQTDCRILQIDCELVTNICKFFGLWNFYLSNF